MIRYQSGISIAAAVKIVKNILEITRKFNPDLLEVMSDIGAKELQIKLEIAAEAGDTVWQTLTDIATRPNYISAFMIVTLVMITFTMLCLVRTLKYGNTRRRYRYIQPKIYSTKMTEITEEDENNQDNDYDDNAAETKLIQLSEIPEREHINSIAEMQLTELKQMRNARNSLSSTWN